MHAFKKLLDVCDQLNGPEGCPWDRKQTFESLKPYILEEAHEVLEALDQGDREGIIEEFGDLIYVILFLAKVAEREGLFDRDEIFEKTAEKLIRRHPHVFGDVKVESEEDVVDVWKQVKAEEKKERKSVLEGIPKSLGALARSRLVIERMRLHGFQVSFDEEKGVGDRLLQIVMEAEREGIDPETELRIALQKREKLFER